MPEIVEFERLLNKPNSDSTGFSGFFNSGGIVLTRVPARLDIMGGIADYSGANVCEGVLGSGIVIALQPRTDRTLRIRTVQAGRKALPVETRIPLEYFEEGDQLGSYAQVRELARANPLSSWAAYIGGSIFTLLKEEGIRLSYGFSLLLLSNVPMNVGIGSSAATEIAVLSCLRAYLALPISETRLARLGQLAENQVVGAPCGIMDQIAVTSGRAGNLTHILCRPGQVQGTVKIPEGTGFVGINSMVKHSVGGSAYGDVRIGAFMGRKIINSERSRMGMEPILYLSEITSEELERDYRQHLPETMRGSEFLKKYQTHDDPVTTVQPDADYRILGPTTHPIQENERVLAFMAALQDGGESGCIRAGEQMFAAHESYQSNCHLSVDEVDFLVEAVRRRGTSSGLYGAKITGGGSGGAVAIFGTKDALAAEIPAIASEYQRRIGLYPDIFEGTSPGAAEFGAMHYEFSSHGWQRL
ncbi:MAG: GHMP kinase [Chthoniobacterales bacterium]